MVKKKKILFFILGLCIALLLVFVLYKRPIESLPNKDDVNSIDITSESGVSKTISNKRSIDEVMTLLNSAYTRFHVFKGTSNDEPTNIPNYMTIKLYVPNQERETNLYLYKNGRRTYLEKPYEDVYRIDSNSIQTIESIINPD